MMIKTLFWMSLAIFCGSACVDNAAHEVVFAVGGAPSELDFWEMLAHEFETETGFPVRVLRRPSNTDQQRQALVISMKAGLADPDVFLMDIAWIGLFRNARWLLPLGADTAGDPFFANVVDTVDRQNGRLIALPVYMDAGLLYYRTDLVDGPPATWQALLDTAAGVQARERQTRPDFFGFVWTGAQYEGLVTVFMEFCGKAGGFIEDNGRIRLNNPANIRGLALMRQMIWEDPISPPNVYTGMKEEDVRMFFQRGKALYERNWPYAWTLHQAPGSLVKDKTGVSRVPAPQGGEGVATLGGYHIGVSRFTDVAPQAEAFVRFITSYRIQKRMVLQLGWNPGRRDLYDDPDILEQAPHFKALKEVFSNARPRPLVPYYSQVSAVAQKHINRVLAGYDNPEPALAAADLEIAALLKRYGVTGEP